MKQLLFAESGFSLIEVTVAAAIFSMGLASLSLLLLTAVMGTAEAGHQTVASTKASSLAEMIATMSILSPLLSLAALLARPVLLNNWRQMKWVSGDRHWQMNCPGAMAWFAVTARLKTATQPMPPVTGQEAWWSRFSGSKRDTRMMKMGG